MFRVFKVSAARRTTPRDFSEQSVVLLLEDLCAKEEEFLFFYFFFFRTDFFERTALRLLLVLRRLSIRLLQVCFRRV